jgi:DNA invertase Pin-like site-specific DNA recombinase
MLAVVAQWEREAIVKRTRDALAAKKRRGEHIGRRRALSPSRLEAAREMLESGHGAARVARILKVGRSTLYRALAVGSAA